MDIANQNRDLAVALAHALHAVEPTLEIRHTDDPADFTYTTLVVLHRPTDYVRMRLHTSLYAGVGGREDLLAAYAEKVVQKMRAEPVRGRISAHRSDV